MAPKRRASQSRNLVAGMTALSGTPVVLSSADLRDLDDQWASVKADEATVPHDEVTRWLRCWGRPSFKPWRDR